MNNKEKYRKFGINPPEFFCLIGEPGIDKTLISTEFVDDYCCYGFDKFERENSSNELKRKEEQIHRILAKCHEKAKAILFENKQFLIALKDKLMINSLISGSDIQIVKNKC